MSADQNKPASRTIQFRPDTETESQIEELVGRTNLTKSELVRRACGFAFPKFLSGEEPIVSAASGA
jgi:hypothetical protein